MEILKEYNIWWCYICKKPLKYTKWSGNNHANVAEAVKCSLLPKHNIFAKAETKNGPVRQATLWEIDFKRGSGVVMLLTAGMMGVDMGTHAEPKLARTW